MILQLETEHAVVANLNTSGILNAEVRPGSTILVGCAPRGLRVKFDNSAGNPTYTDASDPVLWQPTVLRVPPDVSHIHLRNEGTAMIVSVTPVTVL